MDERRRRQTQEFADIVPGQTTELYLDPAQREADDVLAEKRQPALVMLHGDLPGRVFRLHTGRQLIGRRTDCEIRLREKAVSAHHAEIVSTEAGVSVSDLQSTNGTVVNGRRIRNAVFLSQGNLLKLGNSVFKYIDSLVEVELSERLYVRASIDPVTGLSDRAEFLSRFSGLIDTASPARPVSVLVVRFQDIDSADALHKGARMLYEAFASEVNVLARIGEDSFAAALAGVPLASAAAASGNLRRDLEAIGLHSSMGVVSTDRADADVDALLARAEEMAERARREGGNRLVMG
jgi:pSer/pThr/pTyr-binding forkhead associated (FHA) protein